MNHQYLKVKDAEQDYQYNQKLLHHYQHAKNQLNHPQTTEITFSFSEFVSSNKNQLITSSYS